MSSRTAGHEPCRSKGASVPRGIRHSILTAVSVLVVASLAMSPQATATQPGTAPTTRIEVVADGFQTAPAQTFQAVSFDGGIASSVASGGGGGAGRAVLEDLVVTKAIDGVSPLLLDLARTGLRLRSVTVRVFQRAPRDPRETLVLEVAATDVAVSLGHEAVSSSGLGERVDFEATAATFSYPLAGRTVTVGPA